MSAGAYLGLTQMPDFAVVGAGIASISMFVGAANPWNFVNRVDRSGYRARRLVHACGDPWRDSDSATLRVLGGSQDTNEPADGAAHLASPMTGVIVPLADVDDPVVSAGDVLVVTRGAVLGTLLRRMAPDYLLPAGFPNCGIITVSRHDAKVVVGETDASCTLLASA